MRQTSSVLYLAIDSLIPIKGRAIAGLDEFTAALDHAGIPVVFVSSRTRLQLDDPRRKMGHNHPFIAEDGCGAYLPEGYFHLRPERTVRLGRYMCIPVAEQQPAAAERLEELAEATGIEIVPLRSLSPRELSQNSGLPARDADLLRQRDFDEIFFLAGATDADVERLRAEALTRKLQIREHDVLWSAAVGADLKRCVRELGKLYDRALRRHASSVGVATAAEAENLFPACDRRILLGNGKAADMERSGPDDDGEEVQTKRGGLTRAEDFSLRDPELWGKVLERLSPSGR